MNMSKPSLPKGTRDFLPQDMLRRNYIFDTIKSSFIRYGFQPIETPAMENLSILTGKYGEEGDRLIFKILNRGDKLKKAITSIEPDEMSQGKMEHILSAEALRYDLTVPFARFVVQHQNELEFPFKRYQIQPVWRADRPQKGRYREFFQCDADVVGSDSLLFEVELIQLFDEVLSNLHIPDFTIKVNNRKILTGIAEITGQADKIIDITVAIDKLDKIGEDGVVKELEMKDIPLEAIEKIKPLFALKGNVKQIISSMKDMLSTSEIGLKGIDELEYIFNRVNEIGLRSAKLEFDVTLARGLNYYTGAIFEVKANGVSIGSICGGGRYDDLTSIFGLKNLSGVGISFGADRIYDVLNELDLFPKNNAQSTQVLAIHFGENESVAFKQIAELRKHGINAEMYPTSAKLKKQLKYANDKKIQVVLFINEEDVKNNLVEVKNMVTGDQNKVALNSLLDSIRLELNK